MKGVMVQETPACSCGDACTMASRRIFRVEGMDCAHESTPILAALSSLSGVGRAIPSYSDSTLTVEFDPHAVTPERIAQAISGTGFTARIDDREAEALSHWERYGRLTATSVSGVALGTGLILHFLGVQPRVAKLLLLLATVSGGWYVARRAWQALRHRQLEMNTLMATAAVGALFIGEWAEAGSAMFLFSLAQLLEARSMDRARNAIRRLLDLSPKEATVLRGGEEIRLPVERIVVGDTVLLRPGERVPVDGLVVEGASSVNQAPITGESIPVAKAPGSRVLAGSLNGRGILDIRVERPASDSSLARIIHLVENAQAQRARSQTFIDGFARYYTPAMIVFALGLVLLPPVLLGQPFSVWLYRGLVVLVIACPCALVISTPVSIVCGLTRAAREGILFKGGVYLEELGRIRTFFFDKTGTLTRGKPEVVHVRSFSDLPEEQILRLAASLESRSEHPLAGAILEAAGSRRGLDPPPTPTSVQAVPGMGIRGTVNGEICSVGNASFFRDEYVISGQQLAAVEEWERQGATVVLVGSGKMPLGMIALRDAVRKEANSALAELRRLGAGNLTMLTGDNPETGQAIASQLPIDAVYAGLLPEDKVRVVREAVDKGNRVAMVGDGINDAPALASATVGVVMGVAGTGVALEAGDVALMGDDLGKLPFAVRLGRRTLRIIRFNVAFALGTKAVFLVLATAGMATLWMGVAADMGASLLVIGNSMRLLWGSNGSGSRGKPSGGGPDPKGVAQGYRPGRCDRGVLRSGRSGRTLNRRDEMLRVGLLTVLAFVMLGHSGVLAGEPKKIRDNSFLLEEAYNQEPGVIQHIQAFQYMRDKSWNYTFTEEWPVPKETHQLSATVPANHIHSDGTETGIGDIQMNYRYQAVLKDPVALAPRLSLIFPTGDEEKGLGNGAPGFQVNIPASIEIGDKWVTHWNLGATYTPNAKGPGGIRRDTTGFNFGASLVYLLSENLNLLVEAAGSSRESIGGDGLLQREDSFFINSGMRFAVNFKSGLQVVPGIAMPIGVGPSEGEYGVFVYLSLEHPWF